MNSNLRILSALTTRRARFFLGFALVLGLLAITSTGFAVAITAITPDWQSPVGSSGAPSCLYTDNTAPTVELRFGDTDLALPCPSSNLQSGVGFTSSPGGTYTDGTPFLLGELTHYNQQVFAASTVTQATLNLAFTSTNPVTPSITTTVTLNETPNNLTCPYGDTPPCADQMSITPSNLQFSDGGVLYQVEVLGMVPGTAATCAYSETDLRLSLITEESEATSACLFGRVTNVSDAQLEITKTTTATVLIPGEIVEYQIDYSCASTTNSCNDVSLTDFLPAELTYLNSTGSIHTTTPAGIYSAASNTVRFDFIDPLPAGSTGFVTIIARVVNNGTIADNQPITNTATSIQTGGATTTTSTTTPARTVSNWDVQKSGDPIAYISSEPPITDMTYTVQICPDGSNVNLLNAQMVDTLPAGAEFVSATGSPSLSGTPTDTLTWNLGDLAASAGCVARNVVVRFPPAPATPPFTAGQTVTNHVTGAGTIVGGDPWTDTATLVRVLQDFIPNPSMSLNKGTTRTDYVIGAVVDYSLTPRNTGNTNLYNLVMVDTLPDAVRLQRVQLGGSAYPMILEYALNGGTDPSDYVQWGSFPANANQTLNVSSLGLGPTDWVTSLRWRFNPGASTPPNWTLNPSAHIIGVLTSPDRLGVPVAPIPGAQVINTATIAWEYLPGGQGDCTNPNAICDTDPGSATIDIVPVPVPVFDKTSGGGTSQGQRFIIGQQVGYFDLGVNNNTGIAVDQFTLTDDIPVQFAVTAVNVGSFSNWSGSVGLRYQASNNPGVWVTWGTFAEGATVNAPALGANVYITRVEFAYGTIPAGFAGAPRIFGTTLEYDRNGAEVTDGSTMVNNAQMDWVYQGVPSVPRTDSTSDPIRLPTVTPSASKTVISSGPYIPTSAVSYRLNVGAAASSPSNIMNNPVAADLLPAFTNFVSWTYNANGTGMPAPTFELIPNFSGTQTLLRWTFTGSLQRGQTVSIDVNTTLAAGTPAGLLENTMYVTVNDMPVNGGTPDILDVDGDGDHSDSVVTSATNVAVAPLVGLELGKECAWPVGHELLRVPELWPDGAEWQRGLPPARGQSRQCAYQQCERDRYSAKHR